jgi:hypothetical protein
MIGSWPALRGVKIVPALLNVYLLHELKVPDKQTRTRN